MNKKPKQNRSGNHLKTTGSSGKSSPTPTKFPDKISEGHSGVAALHVSSREFSGPYPPPEMLAAYKQVDPSLVTTIIESAKNEQQHRHEMERSTLGLVRHSTWQVYIGQAFAFIIAMTAIIGGVYLIANGHEAQGLSSIIAALVVLAGVFIAGKVIDSHTDDGDEKE